jgi:serine/threonine protein kinase
VKYAAPDWTSITAEAKDLTLRMLEKNPALRISAKEALDHPWFTLEQTGHSKLSMAEENMLKYCNDARFNMGMIKPAFGFVLGFIGNDSSDSPRSSGSSSGWDSGEIIDLNQPFDKYKLQMFNKEESIGREVELVPRDGEDETANFLEDEISENSNSISNRASSSLNKSLVPSVSLTKHWNPIPKSGLQSTEVISTSLKSASLKKKPRKSFDYEQNDFLLQLINVQNKERYNGSEKEVLNNFSKTTSVLVPPKANSPEKSSRVLKNIFEVLNSSRKTTM